MSPASCTPGSQKCVRVLFHFLNNTTNTMNSPSDEFFRKLMEDLNKFFEPGNIHLTFGDHCIFRGPVTPTLTNDAAFVQQFFTNNTFDPKPEMGWDENFLNVYFFQQSIFNGGIARGNWSCHSILDANVLAHELGHNLGLVHTFGPVNGGDPLPRNLWECKNRTETGTKGCLTTGDKLCDTGADPYAMDLDNDGVVDQGKWVNNCAQNISNTIKDDCDDAVLSWNIPVNNIMSQHLSCTNAFSNCQFNIMHTSLEDPNKSEKFVIDCEDDISFETCADITISTPTTWTNEVKTLCRNQKILITSSGSLTLVNTTLTKKTNNTNCPGLTGNWDGIYIQGGSGVTYPGGPSSPSGGSFSATANSIIEHSNKGIQAEKGHLGITVNNSIMRFNPTAINAGGPGGLVYGGTINITSSSISNTAEAAEPNLIKANGCNVNITGSTLTNISSSGVTGLKAFNNRVSIKSATTFQGFYFGVDKEMSGGLAGLQGMTIESSKFLDGIISNHTSIRNRGGNITAKRNWIGGTVDVSGKCNGNWHGNNFRKIVFIDNPTITHKFSENNFFSSNLDLKRNQSLTDATCNRFESTGQAVNGRGPSIKSAWGTDNLSSGNIAVPYASQPIMEFYQSNAITHYHHQPSTEPDEPFYYSGQFDGINAAPNNGCLYNVFPTTPGAVGGSGGSQAYNDSENNSVWTGFNTTYLELLNQLASAPPANILQIQIGIENAQVGMQLAVLEALNNSSELSSESYSIWVARADLIFSQYGQMMNLFCMGNYTSLSSYLNGLSLSGDDATDRNNMLTALGWIQTAISQGKDIFNLNSTDLEVVIDMASETFGNYTTLLRSFLNIYYDIRIDPPQELNQNSRKVKVNKDDKTVKFWIVPNPVEDCFEVKSTSGINRPLNIIIYDMKGRAVMEQSVINSRLCINENMHFGIYMAQIKDVDSQLLTTLKIVIK